MASHRETFLLCQDHPTGERERERETNLFFGDLSVLAARVGPRRENCPSSFLAWTANFYSATWMKEAEERWRRSNSLPNYSVNPPSLPPSGSDGGVFRSRRTVLRRRPPAPLFSPLAPSPCHSLPPTSGRPRDKNELRSPTKKSLTSTELHKNHQQRLKLKRKVSSKQF